MFKQSSKSPPKAPDMAKLIFNGYVLCKHAFDRLLDRIKDPGHQETDYDHSAFSRLEDELERFQVWAGNVGAQRIGRISLDHRLREAIDTRDRVLDLLNSITGQLSDAYNIRVRARPPLDQVSFDSGSSSDDSAAIQRVGIPQR
ncbi:MAG: hypothetical protein M1814_002939 [Vezdaea aestivalis]|nr:MAG: hypothetical protein M1814_002939 [Vezdaea aestivalis]